MTPLRAPVLGGVILAVAIAGCAKRCTLIGCLDGATIKIRTGDGATPAYLVTLDVDGMAVTCPALDPDRGSIVTCAPGITLSRSRVFGCAQTDAAPEAGQLCPPESHFELEIHAAGAPRRLGVILKSADTVVAEGSFPLSYTESWPNGKGCDPLCRQASDSWLLP